MTDRGSFDFWAELSRQTVGHSILDSGSIYGYQHDRPKPAEDDDPIRLEFHDGHLEYATVSLAHVLNEILDASDPVAVALETLLYNAPGGSWNDAVEWLQDNLAGMTECVWEMPGEQPYVNRAAFLDRLPYEMELNEELTDAIVCISNWIRSDDLVFGAGFYTYNHENSLDQDFAVSLFIGNEEMYGDQYAIVRTHNGCDARGGFSEPVVAKVRDNDYLRFCWDADVYCNECGTTWESTYSYLQEEVNWPSFLTLGEWSDRIELVKQYEAGQATFFEGDEPAWDFSIPMEVAEQTLDRYDSEPDAEIQDLLPSALIKGVPVSGSPTTDNCDTALLCPNCRAYTAYVSSSVAYGF